MYTPVNPSFTIYKWGLRGSNFRDGYIVNGDSFIDNEIKRKMSNKRKCVFLQPSSATQINPIQKDVCILSIYVRGVFLCICD